MKLEDGKAVRTNDVSAKTKYLNDAYRLNLKPFHEITATGKLIVAELHPQDLQKPGFTIRWDENRDTIDVDIENVQEDVKWKFRNEEEGYRGHHTQRIKNTKNRIFEVYISIPEQKIFEGEVTITLFRKLQPHLRPP